MIKKILNSVYDGLITWAEAIAEYRKAGFRGHYY
jgi:hypothetical protein